MYFVIIRVQGNIYYSCATNYTLQLLYHQSRQLLQVVLGFSKETESIVCVCVCVCVSKTVYSKELAHMIVEAQQVQNMMMDTGNLETQERVAFLVHMQSSVEPRITDVADKVQRQSSGKVCLVWGRVSLLSYSGIQQIV